MKTGLVAAGHLVLVLGCWISSAQPSPYKPGDRVDVDVIMAGAPERSMWRPGTVKAVENGQLVIATDPVTDAGGRTMGIPLHSLSKWVRPSKQQAPETKGPPAATGPGPSAAVPPAVRAAVPIEGILNCPIEQPKVAQGSRPDPQVLTSVIRCLWEVRGQSPAEKSVKVDVHALEIGASRACVPREDFGCGASGHKIFPALVRWTKSDYYPRSVQWSENDSVFNCFVNAFGKWECGLGQRIRDGKLQNRER